MDANSCVEEQALKVRKPYTITKQRERWSEEEHNRFLEALKLYGRAWQKIEEHIGTKTAIQIRSHAQKFFTKLEKEALAKGIPPGEAHDIDIPPPRPKRKPSIPYPRKTNAGFLSTTGEATTDKAPKLSSNPGLTKQVLATEEGALKEFSTLKKTMEGNEISENVSCSEVLDVQDTISASISSVNKSSTSHCTFREFFPTTSTIKENETNKTAVNVNVNKDPVRGDTDVTGTGVLKNYTNLQINLVEEDKDTLAMQGLALKDKDRCPRNPDKQLIMHDVGENLEKVQCNDSNKENNTGVNGQVRGHGHTDPLMNSTGSGIPSGFQNCTPFGPVHHMFPAVAPFIPCQSDQDAYQSLLNMSSTFSSLIISTLLQNPAVHAAATMAASFWPAPHVSTSTQSHPEVQNGAVTERNVNSPPSTAAIAAATVAAAAAWWATQGLLPCFPPPFGFGFAPAAATTIATPNTLEAHDGTVHEPMKEDQIDRMADQSLEPQHCTSKKSPCSLSLSESEENEIDENSHSTEPNDGPSKSKPLNVNENTDVTNCKEKQYRSSCGSNTPSSSDIETDTVPKDDNAPDVAKEAYFANSSADANHRRFRTFGSLNESWKEVSEEGRLAFRALFNREILPQSFSPPHIDKAMKKGEEDSSKPVDLNINLCTMADLYPINGCAKDEGSEERRTTMDENSKTESGHGKFKVSHTGFKPYKRCSVESKDCGAATSEETGNKRIRVESQAST